MPSLPVIANTHRFAVGGALPNGNPWVNVHHLRWLGAGAATSSDLTAAEGLLRRLYYGTAYASGAAWLTNCVAGVTYTGCTVYPLDGSSVAVVIPVTGAVGTGTGNSLHPSLCYVISLKTNHRGRSYRGRVYLPSPNVGSCNSVGDLNTSVITNTQNQYAGMKTALAAIGFEPVVASYLLTIATPIVTYTMDWRPEHQVRRKS